MVMCFVPLCNHKSDREGCKMLTFPRSPKERWKWKKLIRRADRSPNKNSRICTCHFVNGCKEKGPFLMPWNRGKLFSPKKTPPKQSRTSGAASRKLFCEVSPVEKPVIDLEGWCGDMPSPQPAEGTVDLTIPEVPVCSERYNEDTVGIQPTPETARIADVGVMCELQSSECKCVSLEEENAPLRTELEKIKRQMASLKRDSTITAAENTLLKSKNEALMAERERTQGVFSFSSISEDETMVSHYTGLPNRQTFMALLKLLNNMDIQYCKGWRVTRLDKEHQLFLTLLKLRRGLSNLDLGVRFKISQTTVANIFISFVLALHHVLVKEIMSKVPSLEKVKTDMPACFKEYPNTRLVLDCTEITTANPTLLSKQSRMFSNYKQRITSKGLVGIAPNGAITFVSKLYGGSATDRNIVIDSEVLKCCVPGDGIMADKGFNIEDLMPDGVSLNIPPFKMNPQFTADQVELTMSIARARIHIERAIARIKTFEILRFIPQYLVPYATEIFQVCAALTNLKKPLINEEGVENVEMDGEDY